MQTSGLSPSWWTEIYIWHCCRGSSQHPHADPVRICSRHSGATPVVSDRSCQDRPVTGAFLMANTPTRLLFLGLSSLEGARH